MWSHGRFNFLLLSGLWASLFLAQASLTAAETYSLSESDSTAEVFTVESQINIEGELHTPQKDQAISHPLKVSAKMQYQEQRLPAAGRDARSYRALRLYEECAAQIEVSENRISSKLRPQRNKIAVHGFRQGLKRVALAGALTRNELDLLETPGDSLALAALLPAEQVEVGDSWTVPSWAIQMLTATEAVVKSELSCTLDAVENKVAKVSFKGSLEGAVGGSSTKIQLEGKYTFLLELKYLKQLELQQTEKRTAGPVSPGMDIKANVSFDRYPAVNPAVLTSQDREEVTLQPTDEQLQLELVTPWKLSLKHGRDWHVFQQALGSATLRLVENGSFIAQCDIMQLSTSLPGKHVPAKQFETDIQSALGAQLQNMSELKQDKLKNGTITYSIAASGKARDLDMTWLYYLAADPSGQQSSFVFSVESKLLPKLEPQNGQIIQSVKLK